MTTVVSTGSAKEVHVRVVVRFRPFNGKEKRLEEEYAAAGRYLPKPVDIREKIVTMALSHKDMAKRKPKTMAFDRCLGPKVSQEDAFDYVAQATCEDLLTGFNGTIFMYGQTGSGKTYTMYGDEKSTTFESRGVVPRAFFYVFSQLEHRRDAAEIKDFSVDVSFIEVYGHQIKDLLNPKFKPQLRGVPEALTPLEKRRITTPEQGNALVTEASALRVVKSTDQNATSSRSHMILRMEINVISNDGKSSTGIGNFVDLAGSERRKKTKTTGATAKEGTAINASLTQLGCVISALAKGRRPTYRDHELTRLLKPSLSGNCKTTVCIAASYHGFNRDETISSLGFGIRCKSIKTRVKQNVEMTPAEMLKLIKKLQKEIARLKEGSTKKKKKKKRSTLSPDGEEKTEAGHESFESVLTVDELDGDMFLKLEAERSEVARLQVALDELKEAMAALRKDKESVEIEMDNSHAEVNELKERNESIDARIRELEVIIVGLEAELKHKSEALEKSLLRMGALEDELEAMRQRAEEEVELRKRLQTELDESKEVSIRELSTAKTTADSDRKRTERFQADYRQQLAVVKATKEELTVAREEKRTLTAELKNAKRETEKVAKAKAATDEVLRETEEKSRDLRETLAEVSTAARLQERELSDLRREHTQEIEKVDGELKTHQTQAEELNAKICLLEDKLAETRLSERELETSVRDQVQKNNELRTAAATAKARISALSFEMETTQTEVKSKSDEISALSKKHDALQGKADALAAENTKLMATIDTLRAEDEKQRTQLLTWLKDTQTTSASDRMDLTKGLADIEARLKTQGEELQSSRLQTAEEKQAKEGLRETLDKTTEEKAAVVAENKQLRAELEALRALLTQATADTDSLEEERGEWETERSTLVQNLEQEMTKSKQLEFERGELQSRLETKEDEAATAGATAASRRSEVATLAEQNAYLRNWMKKKHEIMYKKDESEAVRLQQAELKKAAKRAAKRGAAESADVESAGLKEIKRQAEARRLEDEGSRVRQALGVEYLSDNSWEDSD